VISVFGTAPQPFYIANSPNAGATACGVFAGGGGGGVTGCAPTFGLGGLGGGGNSSNSGASIAGVTNSGGGGGGAKGSGGCRIGGAGGSGISYSKTKCSKPNFQRCIRRLVTAMSIQFQETGNVDTECSIRV
jgi:hypothetical protein